MNEPTLLEEMNKWNSSPALRRVYKRWFNLIGKPNGNVLEIGCGFGLYAQYINSKNYVGIDIDKERIEYCKENFKGNFQVADATNLPFLSETFDHVVCMNTIHHGNRKLMIKEMCRVLRKGGTITIIEPYASLSKYIFCKIFRHHEPFKMNIFSEEIEFRFKNNDINVKSVKHMDMIAYQVSGGFSKIGTSFGYKLLSAIDNKIIIKPLCWFFMVRGVKHG